MVECSGTRDVEVGEGEGKTGWQVRLANPERGMVGEGWSERGCRSGACCE